MRNLLLLALCAVSLGCAKSEEASAPNTSEGAPVVAPEGANVAPSEGAASESGKGLQVNPDYKGP